MYSTTSQAQSIQFTGILKFRGPSEASQVWRTFSKRFLECVRLLLIIIAIDGVVNNMKNIIVDLISTTQK